MVCQPGRSHQCPNSRRHGNKASPTGLNDHQRTGTERKIRSWRTGQEWIFYTGETPEEVLASPGPAHPGTELPNQFASQFEELARKVLSPHFGVPLQAAKVPGVPKLFDLVSPDGNIVGDAKYFTLVGGERLPPAKFSVIAEHVWLLEKINAKHKFLVFGNDRKVPARWLARYGHLKNDVRFFFLSDDGELKTVD